MSENEPYGGCTRDVRFGSLADITTCPRMSALPPNSGHRCAGGMSAKCQKRTSYQSAFAVDFDEPNIVYRTSKLIGSDGLLSPPALCASRTHVAQRSSTSGDTDVKRKEKSVLLPATVPTTFRVESSRDLLDIGANEVHLEVSQGGNSILQTCFSRFRTLRQKFLCRLPPTKMTSSTISYLKENRLNQWERVPRSSPAERAYAARQSPTPRRG